MINEIWPYILVFVGMFIEGEMALISTTIAGHEGLIDLSIAIPCAIGGTFLADLVYFFIGKKGGRMRIENNPKWKSKADKLERRLNKSPFLVLLSIRFLYGLRMLAPVIVGMTGMTLQRFSIYSLIAIFIWTAIYASLGYAFGELIQGYLNDIRSIEKHIIGLLILIGTIVWIVYRQKKIPN